jgi:hypothetical protein
MIRNQGAARSLTHRMQCMANALAMAYFDSFTVPVLGSFFPVFGMDWNESCTL